MTKGRTRQSNSLRGRSQSEMPRLMEFERAVLHELQNANGQEEMFLRSSSGLSALLKTLGHQQGRPYFRYVLRDVFGDKSELYQRPTTPAQVLVYAKSVLQRLAKAIHFAPLVLRASCHYVLCEFRKAFPESKQDTTIVVGSLLFLRILCPALVKPEMFGFQPHTPMSLPAGVQIAKILQHTLRGTLLSEHETDAVDANRFINTFKPFVASFVTRFPQIHSTPARCLNRPVDVPSLPLWETESAPSTPNSSTWDLDDADVANSSTSWDRSPSKLRGVSMTTVSMTSDPDSMKHKRKFSFRFWNRVPATTV